MIQDDLINLPKYCFTISVICGSVLVKPLITNDMSSCSGHSGSDSSITRTENQFSLMQHYCSDHTQTQCKHSGKEKCAVN